MAFVAILIVGVVSCGKDENTSGNGENNGGGGDTTSEWVDLGLPSGLLWAKNNLGATAPEEYGNYYAWCDTVKKEVYDQSTYTNANVDVATAILGNDARTPTKEEWEELMANTTAEWVTMNGVSGRKFTAANGNSLFLPAAGLRYGSQLYSEGTGGTYWSSSPSSEMGPDYAWRFDFNENRQRVYYGERTYGQSVRPVHSAQ